MTPILICRESGAASLKAGYEHVDTFKCPKCDAIFTILATAGQPVRPDILAWGLQFSEHDCGPHRSGEGPLSKEGL
jgi:hypothetical protein